MQLTLSIRRAAAGLIAFLATALMLVAAPAVTMPGASAPVAQAQAHHTSGTAVQAASNSLSGIDLYNASNGVRMRVNPGTGFICCYPNSVYAYVPAGRDIVVTWRESSTVTRLTATGWNYVPRIANPQHATLRVI